MSDTLTLEPMNIRDDEPAPTRATRGDLTAFKLALVIGYVATVAVVGFSSAGTFATVFVAFMVPAIVTGALCYHAVTEVDR